MKAANTLEGNHERGMEGSCCGSFTSVTASFKKGMARAEYTAQWAKGLLCRYMDRNSILRSQYKQGVSLTPESKEPQSCHVLPWSCLSSRIQVLKPFGVLETFNFSIQEAEQAGFCEFKACVVT